MAEWTPNLSTLLSLANDLTAGSFRPGIDQMTAKACYDYLCDNGVALLQSLENGNYCPRPAQAFYSPKKGGKERRLTKLTALDLVIQRAAAEHLRDLLEPVFSEYSFAYRPERGVNAAVAAYLVFAKSNPFAAKIDPYSCFDHMDRTILFQLMEQYIPEPSFRALLFRMIESPVADEEGIHTPACGIMQGAPISPVLCNLYFHPLDLALERAGIPFCRYADDIVVFAPSQKSCEERANMVMHFLRDLLHLEPNPEKLFIGAAAGCEYLGVRFEKTEFKNTLMAVLPETKPQLYSPQWKPQPPLRQSPEINLLSDGILSRSDYALLFNNDTGEIYLPVANLNSINIYASVTLASGVLQFFSKNGITVNIFDREGRLVGRYLPFRSLRSPALTLKQLEVYGSKTKRMRIARNMILSALHNLRLNIRYYKKNMPTEQKFDSALEKLKGFEKEIKLCKKPEALLVIEAQVKKTYYDLFDCFIKNKSFAFEQRSKRPPKNQVNAMISFANTVLYNLIAMEINKTSLDIRVAFVHATNAREESLNLDIADIFKPLIVDRTIFSLINRRMIDPKLHFQTFENGGVYLTEEGKRILLSELFRKLDSTITDHETQKSYRQLIRDDVRTLAAAMRGGKYKGFRQVK